MHLKNTSTTYGSVAKSLHWLIFLLVLFMLVFGYFMGDFPKEYKPLVYNIHKLIGLIILFLMILRISWRLFNPKPHSLTNTRNWERYAERLVHFLLYLGLIIMPFSGWIGSVAAGKAPHLGQINFDLPVAANKELSGFAFDIHDNLAIILIILISMHVLAALYHHFFKKDDVLRRMMPRRG